MTYVMRARRQGDAGMSLIELLVAMTIMGIFVAIFSTVAAKMFDSTKSQQARSGNLDSNRNIVQVLDRQLRYANAVNAPVTVNGSQYVTWRSGSIGSSGKVQTCYQWRVTPAGLMQQRSWVLPLTSATAWSTVGTGVRPVEALPIFSLASPIGTGQNRQQLTLQLNSSRGTPRVDTATEVTLTALNTRTSSAPVVPVCQEVAPT
jgi:prepilin-type N-terminal cleavage/methylation domain-containing protein